MTIRLVEPVTVHRMAAVDEAFKDLFGTLDVLLSRGAIFKYTHNYFISEENFKELCKYNKVEWSEGLKEPYFYSMAYAHTVFFASGVESFMQHFYKISVFLYLYGVKVGKIKDLNKLNIEIVNNISKAKTTSKKNRLKDSIFGNDETEAWKTLEPILLKIGKTDLNIMADFFSEIYGSRFKSRISKKEWKKITQTISDVVFDRNGIIHRGGEYSRPEGSPYSRMIKFDVQKFENRHQDLNKITSEIRKLLVWCHKWWRDRNLEIDKLYSKPTDFILN